MQTAELEKQHFYYGDRILAARLKMLRSLASGDDCLNFVIGEKGSGKTTLLNHLLASMAGQWRTCNMRFTSGKGRHKIEAVGNLNRRPGILLDTRTPPMLLFDDAHEISIDGLRYLIRHSLDARPHRKFRGIILFCTPPLDGFIKKLSESVPAQSVINTIHINPLTFEQTEQFLQQWALHLDPAGKIHFSASRIKKIFEASNGLPGKIHDQAKHAASSLPPNRKDRPFKKLFRFFS